ncbi:MAG: transposon-encoded TnpW family protein [Lachnospiraceae bacterium]|nr:transposon-encoded TnpW family protein [Lachnospiraceae bacterium]
MKRWTLRKPLSIPLPVTEGGNAPPAPDAPPPALVQKIGNTIYEVSFHFSTTSRETMSDKISRLVCRDLDAS